MTAEAVLTADRHGADGDVYMQPRGIIGLSDVTAGNRQRLRGVPGDADANQVRAGDEAVGRIILDPTRTRQVDAAPGMRAPPAPRRPRRIVIQVSGDEASSETEAAQGFHHQHRKVAAGSGPESKRLGCVCVPSSCRAP